MTTPQKTQLKWRIIAAGALGSALLGTAGIAAAQTTTDSTAPSTTAGEDSAKSETPRAGETPLTGDDAAKATAAAQAAVPGGTVDRVETDSDGSPYEAHVTKADGTRVTVKLDGAFAATATEAGRGGGKGGGRGHGGDGGSGGARAGETALTGDAADKVTAAALAAVPGGKVVRVENDADGSTYEAHMTEADGKPVTVKLDADFKVTGTETGRK
jgi:uncharacterized membrane protein YkoI